jgi:hypothetical protein
MDKNAILDPTFQHVGAHRPQPVDKLGHPRVAGNRDAGSGSLIKHDSVIKFGRVHGL